MTEKHIIKVDKICEECGFRNKTVMVLEHKMDVIACGNCGSFLSLPDDISEEEQEVMSSIIQQALKEAK
jgi:C4-type Zn-finger protein